MLYFDDVVFGGADEVPACELDVYVDPCQPILNYIHEGRIYYSVDGGRRIVLQGPTAFWTIPGCEYRYGNVTGYGWYQYWVSIGGARVDRMHSEGLITTQHPQWLYLRRPWEFRDHFTRLISLVVSGTIEDQPERVWLLEKLWIHIHRERSDPSPRDAVSRQIRKMARNLIDDPNRPLSFRKEAEQLGISYDHFRRRFRGIFRMGPEAFRQSAKLRAAARELQEGPESITAVAARYGFEDVHYFSRLFKKNFGIPPSRYREQLPI